MPRVRVVMGGDQLGPKLMQNLGRQADLVRRAMRLTAQEVANEIMQDGREDIASSGNFGQRWTDGFKARVSEGGGRILITTSMAVPYWRVFQHGATIQGNPLLWIPLSWTDAVGKSARDYGQPLFRVDRKSGGAPLLLSFDGQPKYSGHVSVEIPKKFHLLEICAQVARTFKQKYRKNRAALGK